MTIYHANILHTPTPSAFEIIPGGYLAVDGEGRVEGLYSSVPDHLAGVRVVDYGDKLLIPAMCDLHVHAPQYRNMGLAMDLQLLPWLQTYTFPEERKFESLEYAAHIYSRFVKELWLQGTMRSAVFATVHPEATKLLADLFLKSQMGAYIGLVGMDRNCPDFLSNSAKDVVSGTRGLYEYICEAGPMSSSLVRPIITPRFVPTCSDEMLEAMGLLARQYNLPVQSHLSENVSEVEWVKSLKPMASSYGSAYHMHGLFGQTPTLMAHCCYTQGQELELMRRQKVVAVHCPTSNCNLASGIAPVRTLLDAGIQVALGTDISGGNNGSILRTIQYAIQVSKLQYSAGKTDSWLTLSEAFYLATKSGGSFFGKVGAFEPGYEFDALVVNDDYLNFDHYSLEERIERYIYLGDDRDICHRFCRGREIIEPRVL